MTWKGSTDGTGWMQRALIGIIRICPLVLVYALMALVIPFYMMFANGFKASYSFFRNRIGYTPVKSFFSVYANEFNLGMVVLDRFAAYAGKRFRIEVSGKELFDNMSSAPEGMIMLGSHLGNHELAGYFLKSEKRVNALVFAGEKETIMEGRTNRFEQTNIRMIPIKEDLSHVFMLNEVLANGEIVSIAGDRSFGSEKRLRSPFFGDEASFPYGPFAMALQRCIRMITVFVIKKGIRQYKVWVEALPEPSGSNRAERTQSLCNAYSATLEKMAKQFPFQWYNFYDFWA